MEEPQAQPSSKPEDESTTKSSAPTSSSTSEAPAAAPATGAAERLAKYKALQARRSQAGKENLKQSAAEQARLASDPNALTAINRKRDIAAHKLLKADTEAAGEDFERKRAWDWTVDESEKWDRRVDKKARHKDEVSFQDYRKEANKVYKRQMRQMNVDVAAYEAGKQAMLDTAVASGGLEIVETETGELIAVDRDGSFYSTAESTSFVESKPDRAAVDRLVDDIRKAEEARLKKRRERRGAEDDGDVTYINEKNKQFNEKLARFYNKYTTDIRESFERGTAL
jgi:pre-mRNA-splicing factor SYF2